MAVLLGDKHRFAVEVGDAAGPALRRVDLWAADQWLTCDDNVVYVPQFCHAVRGTASRVRSGHVPSLPVSGWSPAAAHRRLDAEIKDGGEDYEQFRMYWGWGPTTDNLQAFLFRDGDHLVITFQFWREEHLLRHPEHAGAVFVAKIQAAEFAGILEDLVVALDHDGQGPARSS